MRAGIPNPEVFGVCVPVIVGPKPHADSVVVRYVHGGGCAEIDVLRGRPNEVQHRPRWAASPRRPVRQRAVVSISTIIM